RRPHRRARPTALPAGAGLEISSWLQRYNVLEIARDLPRRHLNRAVYGRLILALARDRVILGWQSDRRHTIKRMALPAASDDRAARREHGWSSQHAQFPQRRRWWR